MILAQGEGVISLEVSAILGENDSTNALALIYKPLPKLQNMQLKAWQKFWIKVKLDSSLNQSKPKYFHFGDQARVDAFVAKDNKILLKIGTNGVTTLYEDRTIKENERVLAIPMHLGNTFYLKYSNFTDKKNIPTLNIIDERQFFQLQKAQNYININAIFLGVLLLVLILSISQYTLLKQNYLAFYIGYIICLIFRTLTLGEFGLIEQKLAFFKFIGFHTGFSFIFILSSLIFYIFFIRSFTNFAKVQPKLDLLFKAQIVYILIFMVFDLSYPYQKFTISTYNNIYRGLQTLNMLWGLINAYMMWKVYNPQNKYLFFGLLSIIVIAIFGQEISIRLNDGTQDIRSSLWVWFIAYTAEILFFTLAITARQRVAQIQLIEKEVALAKLEETFAVQKTDQIIDLENYGNLTINSLKGTLVLPQKEIVRLEASGSYTQFMTHSHSPVLASYNLSEYESKLSEKHFMRVHKSHIVNLEYITHYTKGDGGTLTLRDGSQIPVSRSRKQALTDWLFDKNIA